MSGPKNEFEHLFEKNAKQGKDDIKFSRSHHKRQKADKDLKQSINNRSKGDLLLTASKLPQAMLKISGYCKGKAHAQKHISYITRHGKLELTTHDGSVLKGISAAKELINDWASDFGTRKNSRDMVKIVLSAPENSNPDNLKKAVEEFLKAEFGATNEYVYALHTDTNNPHLHVAIKMVTYQGNKIDPRKNYIEKIRRDFAKCCRNNGILVEASRRYQRGITGTSKNTSIKQMRKNKHNNIIHDRNLNNQIYKDFDSQNQQHIAPERNKIIREEYINSAADLMTLSMKKEGVQQQKTYQIAAKKMLDFAKQMPVEQKFINKLQTKINASKVPDLAITFKEYQLIIANLDSNKLNVINKIDSIKISHQTQRSDIELDI